MSDSVRPHRRKPTRLPRPWDSPGKNTGVGCHFLLQCMKVKSESEVAEYGPTLCDPLDCSPPGSSVHGIFQARVLEWGAVDSLLLQNHDSNLTSSFYKRLTVELMCSILPSNPLTTFHLSKIEDNQTWDLQILKNSLLLLLKVNLGASLMTQW